MKEDHSKFLLKSQGRSPHGQHRKLKNRKKSAKQNQTQKDDEGHASERRLVEIFNRDIVHNRKKVLAHGALHLNETKVPGYLKGETGVIYEQLDLASSKRTNERRSNDETNQKKVGIGYVVKLTINGLLGFNRKNSRKTQVETKYQDHLDSKSVFNRMSTPINQIVDSLHDRELFEIVVRAMDTLGEKEKRYFKERFILHQNYEEIAEKYSANVSTIRSTVCKALKKLKALMEARGIRRE